MASVTYANLSPVGTTYVTECTMCPVGMYSISEGFSHCNSCASGCAFMCAAGQFSEYFVVQTVDSVYSEA